MYYRYNRGPRGRMIGHGGRRPGLMILGILGLMGFAPLGLAVLLGLGVGMIGVVGGLIELAAEILSSLPSVAFSGSSLIIGILIGLILYNRKRDRNTDSADAQGKETAGACAQEETEYYPAETFRSNGT